MATIIFYEEKLQKHLKKIQEAREARPKLIEGLSTHLSELLCRFEKGEKRVTSHINYFNSKKVKRKRASRDLKLVWPSVQKGRTLFLEALRTPEWWVMTKQKKTPPVRLKWPTTLHVKRIFTADAYAEAVCRRDNFKSQVREMAKASKILKKAYKAIKEIPLIEAKVMDSSVEIMRMPDWVSTKRSYLYHIRNNILTEIGSVLSNASDRLDVIDDKLDDLMLEFNFIGERRHLSPSVRWEIEINKPITIGCIQGPSWNQLLINVHKWKRSVRRIDSLNREIIRESGFRRFETELMSVYKQINLLKDEREKILQPIFSIERATRHSRKLKMQLIDK